MHEWGLVKKLIEVLEEEVVKSKIDKVKCVHLRIGQLHNLSPEVVNSCFSHLPKSDKLQDAKIDVELSSGNEFKVKHIEW